MADLKIAKPATEAEKKTQTTTDTWEFTAATAKTWRSPPFQRPLRVNEKVTAAAAEIKNEGGSFPGPSPSGSSTRSGGWWTASIAGRRST